MRISEVEKLVGISKKNIRYYEEEGLLDPAREAGNGYRRYSEDDVLTLRRIKLLRQLAVPIEEIRKLGDGRLTLRDCMERHTIYLNHEQRNLEHIKTICAELAADGATLDSIDIDACEEKIHRLKEGGVRFMKADTEKKQERKDKAIAAATVICSLLLVLGFYIAVSEPAMLWLPLFLFSPILYGIIVSLRERLQEIEKGEEDEAFKY